MTNTQADLERQMDAYPPQPLTVAGLSELCAMGARMLHQQNSRKRALELDSAQVPVLKTSGWPASFGADREGAAAATRIAFTAWQEANMAACAGETLLSRVMGRACTGSGASPSDTPGLITEVVEMRARASAILEDTLVLLRQGVRSRS